MPELIMNSWIFKWCRKQFWFAEVIESKKGNYCINWYVRSPQIVLKSTRIGSIYTNRANQLPKNTINPSSNHSVRHQMKFIRLICRVKRPLYQPWFLICASFGPLMLTACKICKMSISWAVAFFFSRLTKSLSWSLNGWKYGDNNRPCWNWIVKLPQFSPKHQF